MNSTYFYYQDTIAGATSDTVTSSTLQNDSVSSLRKFSNDEVDDIFMAMERRERELDSIARVRAYYAYLRSREEQAPKGFDTTAVPYNLNSENLTIPDNPLEFFDQDYFSSKDTSKPVFHVQAETVEVRAETVEVQPVKKSEPIAPTVPTHEMRPDWLLGVILISLILLAWLKLFYNKFLDQSIQSVANYQLSTKLLRDQNMFSRRVAFALNLNFVLVGSAFVYLMFGYFHLRPFPLNDLLSYLTYAGIIVCVLVLRFTVSHLIGHIFSKHYEFREYLHQLLLIYKSLGIYLLVMVIGIAYINDELRVYLLYISGLLILSALVLRVVKGLKIILSDKDVLIFYLILYLCTLEILPLLIFYRFFSSSVQGGIA